MAPYHTQRTRLTSIPIVLVAVGLSESHANAITVELVGLDHRRIRCQSLDVIVRTTPCRSLFTAQHY